MLIIIRFIIKTSIFIISLLITLVQVIKTYLFVLWYMPLKLGETDQSYLSLIKLISVISIMMIVLAWINAFHLFFNLVSTYNKFNRSTP